MPLHGGTLTASESVLLNFGISPMLGNVHSNNLSVCNLIDSGRIN